MKLLSKLFLACLTLPFILQIAAAQKNTGRTIVGEGEAVTVTLDLPEIKSLALGIQATVEIVQSDQQKITITAQQNIIDNLKREVNKDNWNIEFKDKATDFSPIKVEVAMRTLETLSLGGSGKIESKNTFKNLKDLEVNLGGSGSIKLDASAKDIFCNLGGSGTIQLKGSSEEITVSMAGSGSIKAYDMESQKCEVSSAGSGDIQLNCAKELGASMAGSGDVVYKGNPKLESSIVGSGKLRKE